MNSTAHRCWRSAARVRWANAPRSARQSPVGSGTSISASIASSIRSSSSSLDATYQYRDIAPAPTSRAMRRMLIASGPSASATAMAALTISSRDSPRSRRGGCAPRARCRWTCPAIRSSRASSRDARPERGYSRGYRKNGHCSSSCSSAPSLPASLPPGPFAGRLRGSALPVRLHRRPSCSLTAAPFAAQHARTAGPVTPRRRPDKNLLSRTPYCYGTSYWNVQRTSNGE